MQHLSGFTPGKVCLSLLGTWEGGKGEGWNPTASTALQVLLSIQSLILVPDPFFNEPGYEQRHSGAEGKLQSREYNKKITEGTMRYAMIDLLQVCVLLRTCTCVCVCVCVCV